MVKAVSRFLEGLETLPVPVLLAGQVLEHVAQHPIPTHSAVFGLMVETIGYDRKCVKNTLQG